jgi:nitrite reductase (NADH) small subunit
MTLAISPAVDTATEWYRICRLDDLLAGRGAGALIGGEQVAIFLLWDGTVHAVGNYDPYGHAYVISRGIVGSRGGIPTVASPLYKHVFDLRTGHPLDDPDGPALATYDTRVVEGVVEVLLR